MKQSSPHCSVHHEETASWLCYRCDLFVCGRCQCNHADHAGMETVDELFLNSRQRIADTLTHLTETTSNMTAAVDGRKTVLRSETEWVKKGIKKRSDKMIHEIKQETQSLNDKVDSWYREQLEALDSQYDEWKCSFPSLRARKRWMLFAEELMSKGSITE